VKSRLVVIDLYPSLLQPEGDRGNALVLAHRARQYGVDAEVVVVHPGDDVPAADIVCIGGSEDVDLTIAAKRLRESGHLTRLAASGAVVFGVGAGYVLLSRSFTDTSGVRHQGAGLLDVEMHDAGELIAGPVLTESSADLGHRPLTGYEYHGRVGTLGGDAAPWLRLEVGRGDAGAAGAWREGVIGTWIHGPVLPRNPGLADHLLRWADVAIDPGGCPEDQIAAAVAERRIAEASR
jgi:CobQ-like glutamine amidotransferase family enzyme